MISDKKTEKLDWIIGDDLGWRHQCRQGGPLQEVSGTDISGEGVSVRGYSKR